MTTTACAKPMELQGPHGIPRKGTLDSRERWRRFWKGAPVDHLPDYEFGWWEENFDVWQDQGLPCWVDSIAKGELYFGLEQRLCFPANVGMRPGFQPQVIEEREKTRVVLDGSGVLCEIPKDGHSTIPHYLKFPVETQEDWNSFKTRLDPQDPFRMPDRMDECVRRFRRRDYALGVNVGSLFGWIRNWMGFENACMAVKDDPGLIEDMLEHITVLVCSVMERVLPLLEFDFAHFWEDMCFNDGPMISPSDFRSMMVPRYRRITSLLRKYGVDVVLVDCDGDINMLAPMWLEVGVNVMFPLEVHAGSDPVALRKRFGKDILLCGGVDKMQLLKGKRAIAAELDRLQPLVEQGGFLPHVDHRCPPDVRLVDYVYYLEEKRKRFGIPL